MRDPDEPLCGFEDEDARGKAQPVGFCPECGAALWDGDRIYFGRGTDHVVGCEHCLDIVYAGGAA